MNDGETAASISASARELEPKVRRTAKDPPTKIAHLSDQVAVRMVGNGESAAMRYSVVTQPAAGMDFGSAHASQTVFSISNVKRGARNGGGSNQAANLVKPVPDITIINPGGKKSLEYIRDAIENALENCNDENMTKQSPVKVSESTTMVLNQHQFENHRASERRKKASTATEEETEMRLGGALHEEEEDVA